MPNATPEELAYLQGKIDEAVAVVRKALAEHLDGHELVGRVVLLSGGNDSTTLAHALHFNFPDDLRATHAAHANTTIGVEATRVFVRETCAEWGLPLIEKLPPKTYRQLVTEPDPRGRFHFFPGPSMHFKMFTRLKERCLEQVRNDLVQGKPRQNRVLFIAGRRRQESDRRANIPENERKGSIIWASPFVEWSKADLDLYRRVYMVKRNTVADSLGMSGECLCGAFAQPGEFHRIAEHFPEVAQEISDIQDEVTTVIAAERQRRLLAVRRYQMEVRRLRLAGRRQEFHQAMKLLAEARKKYATPVAPSPGCDKWGWGAYRADPNGQPPQTGPLCSSCDARFDPNVARSTERTPEFQAILDRRAARKAAAS